MCVIPHCPVTISPANKNVNAPSVRTLYDLRKTIRARKDREIDSVAEEWEAISSHNTIVNNFSVTQVPSKKVWILQQNFETWVLLFSPSLTPSWKLVVRPLLLKCGCYTTKKYCKFGVSKNVLGWSKEQVWRHLFTIFWIPFGSAKIS